MIGAFSVGGDRIVSGSVDGTVRVWDVASGAELTVLRGLQCIELRCLARIVSGLDNGIPFVVSPAIGVSPLTSVPAAKNTDNVAVGRVLVGGASSAVRRVINLRLKGPGIFWHEEHAEQMLLLRAYYKSNHWQVLTNKAFAPPLINAV